jgi:hypothetical protein
MNKIHFSLILTCMFSMFFISCEKAGLQDSIKGNAEIEYRVIEDCEDCPVQHCCCIIEIDENGGDAELDLCGVYTNTSPTTPCGPFSPPSPCSTIPAGGNSPIDLDLLINPRDFFCLPFGGSFRIYNRGLQTASLKMTCQADETTNPMFVQFRIDPMEEIFFTETGDCILEECD